ncbi:MAG: hypothetical protein NTX49_00670 [Chlamydiae bacterium]|nr:hypothetical protein [Chlamydiota bacterium]
MSIRLDLDRALAGANIPIEEIHPDAARVLAGSFVGRIGANVGNILFEAFGIPTRIRQTPPLEVDRRSYDIFQRAQADFEAAKPTVRRIFVATQQLRSNNEILNKELEFQSNPYVKTGRYALDAISVCAAGRGIGLLQTVPLLSAEGGTIAAGTIAGAVAPQLIKHRFLPDRAAAIQAKAADIRENTRVLNELWAELEGDHRRAPPEDLIQAGIDLQDQVGDNETTYHHLDRRFAVPAPMPAAPQMLAIQDAAAEVAPL